MGTALRSKLLIMLSILETGSGDLVSPRGTHVFPPPGAQDLQYETGTDNSEIDRVWSDTRSAAASADDLDLRGSLASAIDGAVLNFAEVCCIAIRNRSSTGTLSIGGGSNPFISWLGASGDIIKVPPGGILFLFNPVGGFATTAGTADILRIDPGADTIEYDVLIAGRSA
jgi:hypothetical protein